MAAQKGKSFVLQQGDAGGPEVFTTVGGFRTNTFTINQEQVDITNKDSSNKRTLLAGAGVLSMSASGSGVFLDDAVIASINTNILADTHGNWQVEVPDFGTYEGAFQITSLEFAGEYNGEVTYTLQIESAGAITFTPA